MNDRNNAPTRVEPLYCPVCPSDPPKTRRKPTDLVCGDCYRQYTNETATAMAKKGGEFQDLFSWVAEKAPAILTSLEELYTSAKTEVEKLQNEVGEETIAALKESSGGKAVPREVWTQAYRQKKQELWRARGGNVKYAIMKGLESRIALLKGIIEKAENPEPKPAEPESTLEASAAPTPAPEILTPPELKLKPKPRRTNKTKAEAGERKPKSTRRAKAAALDQQELEEEATEAIAGETSES